MNKKTEAAAVIHWSSKKITRVVSSSLAAETPQSSTNDGDFVSGETVIGRTYWKPDRADTVSSTHRFQEPVVLHPQYKLLQ